jgi:outer membrane lipase/esterase
MKKPLSAITIALLSCLLPVATQAQSIQGITVFGDSFSDNGNILRVTNGQFPPRIFYYNGRLTNGPNWTDFLSESLGAPSLNFAYGGATSGTANTAIIPGITVTLPGVTTQVNDFLQTSPQVSSDRLYIIWVGANDYWGNKATTPAPVITNISTHLNRLVAAGATQFIVPNLPDLGRIPASAHNQAVLSPLTTAHNQSLHAALRDLAQSNPKLTIIPVDVAALLNEVMNDPTRFGFTNVTEPCFNGSSVCASTLQYLSWDGVHPNVTANKIIADYTQNLVVAPQTIAPQSDLVLDLAQRAIHNVHRRLLTTRSRNPLGLFVEADFGTRKQSGTAGYDLETRSITVGADYRTTPDLALGFALTYGGGSSDLSNNLSKIALNGVLLSAYGSYTQNRLRADALINYGWTAIDIERRVNVAGFKSAIADTAGQQLSFQANVGYDLGAHQWSLMPLAGIRYTNVSVNDYTERNASVLNLKVNGQSSDSLVANLGTQLSYTFKTKSGSVMPFIAVNYERELAHTSRTVSAELLSQPGIPLRSTTPERDRDSVQFSTGVQTVFNNNLSMGIAYETTLGKQNHSDNAVQIQVKYNF